MEGELKERFQAVQKVVAEKLALRMHTIKELRVKRDQLVALRKDLEAITKAQTFLQSVAMATQQEVEIRVSAVATMALSLVFGNPYEVKLHFVPKRGKSEAVLSFFRDGEEFDPMEDTGGGAVDIASFALRVSCVLMLNTLDKVLVLDEPFRFVSHDLLPNVCSMLKEVKSRTGVQFLIVTHIEELVQASDRTFVVSRRGERPSKVGVQE